MTPKRRKLAKGVHYADDPPPEYENIILIKKYGNTGVGYFKDGVYRDRGRNNRDIVVGWCYPIPREDLKAMIDAAT